LEGIRRAFELGAPGVEIDVIFDRERDGLYVISEEAYTAGDPVALGLSDMLAAVPLQRFIWLDFWNLKQLSAEDASHAMTRLRADLDTAKIRDRAIVESVSAEGLRLAAALAIRTSLWLEITPTRAGRLAHLRDLMDATLKFRAANASVISLDYVQYQESVGFVFSGVPIHLFTVNDPDRLRELSEDPRVKVILTDYLPVPIPGCQSTGS